MPSNPYDPPTASLAITEPSEPSEDRFHVLGKTIVAWEKLRFVYNAVMGIFVVAVIAFSWSTGGVRFTPEIFAGAVLANLLYCLGPLVDGYLTWFGLRQELQETTRP